MTTAGRAALPEEFVRLVEEMVEEAGRDFAGWHWEEKFTCSCSRKSVVLRGPVAPEALSPEHEGWCAEALSARSAAFAAEVADLAEEAHDLAGEGVALLRAGRVGEAADKLEAAWAAGLRSRLDPGYSRVSGLVRERAGEAAGGASGRAVRLRTVTQDGAPRGWFVVEELPGIVEVVANLRGSCVLEEAALTILREVQVSCADKPVSVFLTGRPRCAVILPGRVSQETIIDGLRGKF